MTHVTDKHTVPCITYTVDIHLAPGSLISPLGDPIIKFFNTVTVEYKTPVVTPAVKYVCVAVLSSIIEN